jgi:hypothetical protein
MGRYPATTMIAMVDFTLFVGDHIVAEGLLIRLESSAVFFRHAMSACAVAGCAVAEWSSIRLAAGRGEIAETTVNSNVLRLKEAWTKIREALSDRDTSFYQLDLIPDGFNKALLCARQQATLL